ncbi:MAG: TVP38/TMEM64 family protein [Methylocella sp.]
MAYIAAVLAGILIYYIHHAEIQGRLLAAGDLDGWTTSMRQAVWAMVLFLAFAISLFFSIPAGPLFYIAFGFFYGPYVGTLMAALATTLGSVAAFYFFRRAMPQSAALQRAGIKNAFATLLLLRLSPWLPNPLITLFCSAFDVGIWTFALTTFVGTMPLIAVYAIAANRLRGHLDASVLYSTDIAVAFGLLGAVSLVGFLKPVRMALDWLKTIEVDISGEKQPAANIRTGWPFALIRRRAARSPKAMFPARPLGPDPDETPPLPRR